MAHNALDASIRGRVRGGGSGHNQIVKKHLSKGNLLVDTFYNTWLLFFQVLVP